MVSYWVKTPKWFKRLYSNNIIWDFKEDSENTVYLTFDDGPHPEATTFVLQQLEKYEAKATFFCVGNNVTLYPDVYTDILLKGHSTGNHTFDHLNGWKTNSNNYINNILKANNYINSKLFRPPYGRIKFSQNRKLKKNNKDWKIVMWSVLSGDFDVNITPEQCIENVLTNIKPGAIVIFHDSKKAYERMSFALPYVLAYCKEKNWKLKAIPM